jgi:hypothetical protein
VYAFTVPLQYIVHSTQYTVHRTQYTVHSTQYSNQPAYRRSELNLGVRVHGAAAHAHCLRQRVLAQVPAIAQSYETEKTDERDRGRRKERDRATERQRDRDRETETQRDRETESERER